MGVTLPITNGYGSGGLNVRNRVPPKVSLAVEADSPRLVVDVSFALERCKTRLYYGNALLREASTLP
jgi:hypothetical protein